jgi:polyhydroxyalkanoate synthesis regulator phasin
MEKNQEIPANCKGLVPQDTLERNTGDALTMIVMKELLDKLDRLERRVRELERKTKKG